MKLNVLAFFMIFYFKLGEGFKTYDKKDMFKFREEVKEMFYHAYNSYLKYAYPYDELRPISCDGVDTYGSYSLTLIDALDTLAIMGNYSEFQRVVDILTSKENFDSNINVSVFETNIRIVGGLLSAHLLSNKAGVKLEPGWPCNGPLLRLAEDVAKRLIAAFDTPTGMPYGTVNLRHGVPKGETTVTCTAGIGTFIVEFGTLSRLTGDPLYEEVAMNALYSLFNHRSQIGLFGNHIDVSTGRWTAQDAGIGSGIDSYFEYLVKGSILLQRPELMEMFHEIRKGIDKFLKRDSWYLWVSMTKGSVTIPVFQSLEAYWPGVLSLIGETSSAMKTLHNYHQVWLQYGFTPEFYNIPQTEAGTNRENYPLRPELIESVMYLYRATGDPYLIQIGVDILRSLQHSAKTPCGYATIKDVRDHRKEDRMESFFLAETTKYLYLLFDTDNFIHNQGQHGTVINTPNGECIIEAGGYIFNTEAHPMDPSALHCCYDVPKQKLFDFTQLNTMKNIFKGESIKKKVDEINLRKPSEFTEKKGDNKEGSNELFSNSNENSIKKSENSMGQSESFMDKSEKSIKENKSSLTESENSMRESENFSKGNNKPFGEILNSFEENEKPSRDNEYNFEGNEENSRGNGENEKYFGKSMKTFQDEIRFEENENIEKIILEDNNPKQDSGNKKGDINENGSQHRKSNQVTVNDNSISNEDNLNTYEILNGIKVEENIDSTLEIITESTIKLDDNASYDLKSNQDVQGTAIVEELSDLNLQGLDNPSEKTLEDNFVPEPPPNSTMTLFKFDPQAILERIRMQNNYPQNKTWESNYKLLTCKAQPFIEKMSIYGEFFNR